MAEEQKQVRSHPSSCSPLAHPITADTDRAATAVSFLRSCPHLQAQVAKLKAQIPEKYLTKQPVLVGPGRTLEMTPSKAS